ncbi:MAG: hypothetical protein NTW56_02200 [Alphaproteobacteria bacterium]|nr:hypothetical protein [Alphaproteobacteria bacterium]
MPTFNTSDAIAAQIVRLEAAGFTHAMPLLRAAAAGALHLVALPPGARVPLRLLDATRQRKALVVLLGGDHGLIQHGPEAWPQSRRLLAWSRWTLLHGAGGEARHYALAAQATCLFGRALIAECSSHHLPAWRALREEVAPRTPGMIVECRPGDCHPRLGAPAGAVLQ